MEFDLNSFTKRLYDLMENNMPIDNSYVHDRKHKGRRHMKETALGDNSIIPVGLDSQYFEIGNENAERTTPQYHILNDAEVIRKRGRGTAKSRGSQELISDKGARDYGIAQFKYSKDKKSVNPYYEYRKNVRGSRSKISKATRKEISSNGEIITINRDSKYYLNTHYQYIDKNALFSAQVLASEYDLKLSRTSIDYTEEYDEWLKQNKDFIESLTSDND